MKLDVEYGENGSYLLVMHYKPTKLDMDSLAKGFHEQALPRENM